MNPTQNAETSEKSAPVSCQPLLETLAKLGSSWAAHGLKIGSNAVQMSAETLGKTAQTLDTLAAAFQAKAAKGVSEADVADSPEAAPPVEKGAPAAGATGAEAAS